jgi:hypothetical protein
LTIPKSFYTRNGFKSKKRGELLADDIMPPLAPGAKRGSNKGFFARLFNGKEDASLPTSQSSEIEPKNSIFNDQDLDKPEQKQGQTTVQPNQAQKQARPPEMDDMTLEKIRQQLGLAIQKGQANEIPEPPAIGKKDDKKAQPPKEEDFSFELPSIDMDGEDEPRNDDLLEEKADSKKDEGDDLDIDDFTKDYTKGITEPPKIRQEKEKTKQTHEITSTESDWAKEADLSHHDAKSIEPSPFTSPVPTKDDDTEKGRVGFDNDGIIPARIASINKPTAKTPELDEDLVPPKPDSLKKEKEPEKKKGERPKSKPAKTAEEKYKEEKQVKPIPAPVEKPEEKVEKEKRVEDDKEKSISQERPPEITPAFDEEGLRRRLEKEAADKAADAVSNEREALKKEKQAFEQEKISVAGKANRIDFREKQLNKMQEDIDQSKKDLENQRSLITSERNQLDKDREESQKIEQSLPAMKAEYDKLMAKLDSLKDQIRINSQMEENLKRRETALAQAQTRLEEMEERIKDQGFSEYLESELKGHKLVAPKIPNENVLKEKNPDIYNLLEDCKTLVSKNKIGEAKEVYMRLRNIYQHMPQEDPLKELVYTLIRELYDDINLASIKLK